MADPIPHGFNGLIAHLVCSPCTDAIAFYTKAFGAQELCRMPGPDGRLMHAAMQVGDSVIFLNDDFPEYCGGASRTATALGNTPVTLHRYVKDCDAVIRQAEQAGATVVMPAADMFWGDRYGLIRDPFGHQWALATHQKDMTPEEMMAASKAAFAHAPS